MHSSLGFTPEAMELSNSFKSKSNSTPHNLPLGHNYFRKLIGLKACYKAGLCIQFYISIHRNTYFYIHNIFSKLSNIFLVQRSHFWQLHSLPNTGHNFELMGKCLGVKKIVIKYSLNPPFFIPVMNYLLLCVCINKCDCCIISTRHTRCSKYD